MKVMETVPHKYQEICDNILARIERGELEQGMRLPGVRALGEKYGCNYHTVRHAFEALAEQGYVELRQGSGTFVTERAGDFQQRKVAAEKVLRTTDKIGVLLPMKHWGYYVTSLIDQLHHSAEAKKIILNIRTVTEIDINSAKLAHEFMEQGCCSIILPWLGEGQNLGDLHDFVRASVLPVVTPNPVHGLEDNCYRNPGVDLDTSRSETYLQCRYFQELGFENIALLGPSAETAEFFERKLLQYCRWIDRENLPNLIGLIDGSRNDYDRIIRRWSKMRGALAVIAYHDEMAMEFMDACHRKGFVVPDDFAVLGHNNNPNGLRADPPLSTMLCPYECIADGMLVHALALSGGRSAQLSGQEPQAFYIRQSCGGRARLGDGAVDALIAGLLKEVARV
ncbi:MAG: GntR family transcriptional regulator [Pontiellaceae bacterium]|nr:GntR family transcriptional regulator [Pontiellaceae bacterium]